MQIAAEEVLESNIYQLCTAEVLYLRTAEQLYCRGVKTLRDLVQLSPQEVEYIARGYPGPTAEILEAADVVRFACTRLHD